MNPPTDPIQLVVYGLGTILVVLALKLWDRRRDGKLQRTADEAVRQAGAAAAHASTASEHAGAAADAVGQLEQKTATRASGKQAEDLLQVGHDTNATLIQLATMLGEVRADVRRLRGIPQRVAELERHVDEFTFPDPVRRRQHN